MGISKAGGLGSGQTWQVVTRAAGVTYYNTTSKPIMYQIMALGTSGQAFSRTVSINGGVAINILRGFWGANDAGGQGATGVTIIPAGASYIFADTFISSQTSTELR